MNWRSTVTSALINRASVKATSSETSEKLKKRLSELTDQDWGTFAQEWRNSYKQFVSSFVPGETEWRDIDTHHYLSLAELLMKWNMEGLYVDDEMKGLSLIWHFLDPWTDSSRGLHLLGTQFVTSTLSNGNQSLLKDLQEYGDLGFQRLQSSADFKAYKPHPSVYRGAAAAMGLETSEVAMVAAHLGDLKAAKGCGMKTIYVERKREEDWNPQEKEYLDSKEWVDMWVGEEEGGFLEVARRFGLH